MRSGTSAFSCPDTLAELRVHSSPGRPSSLSGDLRGSGGRGAGEPAGACRATAPLPRARTARPGPAPSRPRLRAAAAAAPWGRRCGPPGSCAYRAVMKTRNTLEGRMWRSCSSWRCVSSPAARAQAAEAGASGPRRRADEVECIRCRQRRCWHARPRPGPLRAPPSSAAAAPPAAGGSAAARSQAAPSPTCIEQQRVLRLEQRDAGAGLPAAGQPAHAAQERQQHLARVGQQRVPHLPGERGGGGACSVRLPAQSRRGQRRRSCRLRGAAAAAGLRAWHPCSQASQALGRQRSRGLRPPSGASSVGAHRFRWQPCCVQVVAAAPAAHREWRHVVAAAGAG
jgi:hypothetical protein